MVISDPVSGSPMIVRSGDITMESGKNGKIKKDCEQLFAVLLVLLLSFGKPVFYPITFLRAFCIVKMLERTDQIAGNADDIAVGRIEGQITDTFAEGTLDDIEQELVVLMYRRIDRENITGT